MVKHIFSRSALACENRLANFFSTIFLQFFLPAEWFVGLLCLLWLVSQQGGDATKMTRQITMCTECVQYSESRRSNVYLHVLEPHFSSSRLVTSLRLLAVEPDLVTLRSHHPYSVENKTPWVQCFFFQFLLVVGVKWWRFSYNWRFKSQTSHLFAYPHSKGHTIQTCTKLLDLPSLFETVLLIARKIFLLAF